MNDVCLYKIKTVSYTVQSVHRIKNKQLKDFISLLPHYLWRYFTFLV